MKPAAKALLDAMLRLLGNKPFRPIIIVCDDDSEYLVNASDHVLVTKKSLHVGIPSEVPGVMEKIVKVGWSDIEKIHVSGAPSVAGTAPQATGPAVLSKSTSWELFTDGACEGNPGPGGWAFILRNPADAKEFRDSGGERETTNNRMELTSVIRGLEAINGSSEIRLVTDSQYVSKGISEWMPGWKKKGWKRVVNGKLKPVANEDLWRRLDELLANHRVTCQWVRGHAGHPENEECDRMAVEAIRNL
jgi:ribonuclease HI